MSNLSPVVVLSHGPGGLGAVRSLGRRGVPVTAIAFKKTDPVLFSRHATEKLSILGDDDEAREARLLDVLQKLPLEGAAILTTSDRLVAFLARHQEQLLRKFRFRLPPPEILEALNDKRLETALVQRLGFSIPTTIPVLPDAPGQLAEQLRFPIIFKPHVYFVQKVFPLKNVVVCDRDELEKFYREWQPALSVLLAQEVIPGPDDYSWICSTTFDENHSMLACGIKQKLRALPAHFGGSTFAVSRKNSDIHELARRLGLVLGYVGHAGIEFRWDGRDNAYKYIELNPRMPANVGFDEASGMPTVWNSYQVALSGTADARHADLKENIYYLDAKDDLLSLRMDGTPKLKALTTLLSLVLFRRTNGPYFAWDDPRPGLVVASRYLLSQLRSIRGNVRRSVGKHWQNSRPRPKTRER